MKKVEKSTFKNRVLKKSTSIRVRFREGMKRGILLIWTLIGTLNARSVGKNQENQEKEGPPVDEPIDTGMSHNQ